MGHDDKKPTITDVKLPPEPKAPETITVTLDALKMLIAQGIAEKFGRPYDEQVQEEFDRMRGKDRPLPPEDLIPCRSPVSGAMFTARLIKSKSFPSGRVVELLDYKRPPGTDAHKEDGGLYGGPREGMLPVLRDNPDAAQYLYLRWIYSFFQNDWNLLSGKPGSFLAQWRVTPDVPKAAE